MPWTNTIAKSKNRSYRLWIVHCAGSTGKTADPSYAWQTGAAPALNSHSYPNKRYKRLNSANLTPNICSLFLSQEESAMKSLRCLAVVPIYEAMTGNICVYYEAERRGRQTAVYSTNANAPFFASTGSTRRISKESPPGLGIKKSLPLGFPSDCIFMPVKVRVPVPDRTAPMPMCVMKPYRIFQTIRSF